MPRHQLAQTRIRSSGTGLSLLSVAIDGMDNSTTPTAWADAFARRLRAAARKMIGQSASDSSSSEALRSRAISSMAVSSAQLIDLPEISRIRHAQMIPDALAAYPAIRVAPCSANRLILQLEMIAPLGRPIDCGSAGSGRRRSEQHRFQRQQHREERKRVGIHRRLMRGGHAVQRDPQPHRETLRDYEIPGSEEPAD